jgi:hypothetical protein
MDLKSTGIAESASDRMLDLAPDLPRALALKAGVIASLRDHRQFDRATTLAEQALAKSPFENWVNG